MVVSTFFSTLDLVSKAFNNPSERFTLIEGIYGELCGEKKKDVTHILKDRIKENRLYIKKSVDVNQLFGDPAIRIPKQLYVKYKVGDDERTITIPEFKTKLKRDLLLDGNFVVKIKCYHESGLHHYHNPYPRLKYTAESPL